MTVLTQRQFGQRIQGLRDEAGVSQEDLARHLGITRQAVGQIEGGKRRVDSVELSMLAEFFSVSADALLKPEMSEAKRRGPRTEMHSFLLNADKLKNLLLYLLEKCGGKPNVGETVIYKLLYFIDFDAYELLGVPVTGMSYVRLQFGPVPRKAEYDAVIKRMVADEELKVFTHHYFGKAQKRYVALHEPSVDVFSAREMEVVDKVIARLSDMNATDIENYVHLDAPWIKTAENQVINYDLVFERDFPYAKRDYGKAWEGAAAKDLLSQLGSMSKDEADYYDKL